ncbi:hypothetical protein [Oceanisphaera ostreae]|uniref:DUF3085 domain-containing protein n=1 Tax=Oceanisphaera ostreae TaxID=914151 RepID=A0ABW3KKC4_9GAMM
MSLSLFELKAAHTNGTLVMGLDRHGVLYLPDTSGGAQSIFICAAYDGLTLHNDGKHNYYPMEWFLKELGADSATIKAARDKFASCPVIAGIRAGLEEEGFFSGSAK